MKKTGIFYGSSTGTTEDIANRIATALGIDSADVHNATDLTADLVNGYEALLLGSSTWGAGDLQDDWYDAVNTLKTADLKGKVIGLFGCGDSSSFGDTFCDAIGTLYNDLKDSGATFLPGVDAGDYTYDDSTSVVDGKFVGLAIDEMNESDKTDERIAAWVATIKPLLA